jgi:hypothetical protein
MAAMIAVSLLIAALAATPIQPTCARFGAAERLTTLGLNTLIESSGLAISAADPNLLWTHNDSGDAPVIYAFGLDGAERGRITLEGAFADDWEALGLGPCGGKTCLVVGDIGSTRRQGSEMVLWRFVEPAAPGAGETQALTAQRLTLTFNDPPFDAEGLAVDPRNGDIFIIEKSLDQIFSVYRVAAAAWDGPSAQTVPETLWAIQLRGGIEASLVTQADIDPSGSELFIGTYGAGFRLPIKRNSDAVITSFGEPIPGPIYGDGQCEAGAYAPDGLSIWFTCEAAEAPLARANCVEQTAGETPPAEPAASCSCAGAGSAALLLWILPLGLCRRYLGRH